MTQTQVRELEVDVIVRCSASAYDEYVGGFDVLVPSNSMLSNVFERTWLELGIPKQ